jgi:hypothetical protein
MWPRSYLRGVGSSFRRLPQRSRRCPLGAARHFFGERRQGGGEPGGGPQLAAQPGCPPAHETVPGEAAPVLPKPSEPERKPPAGGVQTRSEGPRYHGAAGQPPMKVGRHLRLTGGSVVSAERTVFLDDQLTPPQWALCRVRVYVEWQRWPVHLLLVHRTTECSRVVVVALVQAGRRPLARLHRPGAERGDGNGRAPARRQRRAEHGPCAASSARLGRLDVILATDDGEVLEVVRAAVAELIKLDSGVTLNANVFKAAG